MGMADRIKERRLAMNLTQEELAEKLGLQKSAIAKYENGRVENIKRSVIAQMSNILECSPAYLMGWDNTPPPPAPEHSIEKIIDATKEQLLTQDGLTLEGRPACPESIDSVLTSMTIGVEMAKQKNRKIPEPKELTRTQKVPAISDYTKAEAAHLRTDIEVTPEQIQADDDIMNDDSEWT